jgi:hypothetical protein
MLNHLDLAAILFVYTTLSTINYPPPHHLVQLNQPPPLEQSPCQPSLSDISFESDWSILLLGTLQGKCYKNILLELLI